MRPTRLLLAAAAAIVSLAACSTGTSTPTAGGTLAGGAVDANAAAVGKGGTVTYSVNADVKNWNILHATGDSFAYRQVLNPVLPHAVVAQPDFSLAANPALVSKVEVTSQSPQTVVYRLRPEAVWSDGTPISADDFVYTWKVQSPLQCPACQPANTAGYKLIESVQGSEGGKTVTVVFSSPFQPWRLLFPHLLPAHIAAQHGDLATSFNTYFVTTMPTWSGGPFVITEFRPNQSVTMVPNPKWYGEGPYLEKFVVRILTDERQAVTAMANNEVQVLAPTPTLDIVQQLRANRDLTVVTAAGLLYEHLDANTNHPALADLTLRKAIFTAVSRQAIIDKTVGQYAPGVKPLGNRHFMPGQKLDGVDAYVDTVTPLGLGNGNVEAATKLLTDAGYRVSASALVDPKGATVPPLRMVYSKGNQTRKEICTLLQTTLAPLGLRLQLEETDSLGKTITTSNFDLVLYGTNIDAIPTSTAQAIFAIDKPHTGYKDRELNQWLAQAAGAADARTAVDLVNKAEARLSEKAGTLPIYQTPTVLAFRSSLGNVRVNPTRFGTTYNVEQWGTKKAGG